MKRIIIIFIGFIPIVVFGQQFPFMEGYNVNPFSLSPAYAGIHNSKILFVDYRSDWSGLEGGPTTCQLSYNTKFNENKRSQGNFKNYQPYNFKNRMGLGGRFIYDKTDIFKQTLLLVTYTYEIRIAKKHFVNFGLSTGFFRNSIDLAKYYNDSKYVQDEALTYGLEKSKIKFATDISMLYRNKRVEGGVLFSNIIFGTARYSNTDMTYKPLKNYLLHTSYLFKIDNKWSARPVFILRGGQNIPIQIEIAPSIIWNDRFWGTVLFRTGGIFGAGIGGEIYDGIIINYSYNLSTNVSLNTFGSHQLSLGIKLFNSQKNKKF